MPFPTDPKSAEFTPPVFRHSAGLAIAFFLSTVCSLCFAHEDAAMLHGKNWETENSVQLSDFPNFKPARQELTKYGGWLNHKERATGFFHTAQISGCWWLVDPDGCLFLSVGVNSVVEGFARPDGKAGNPTGEGASQWAKDTLALLRGDGFNTLGCWSDTDTLRRQPEPMAYCLRWNFMAAYRATRKAKYPATGIAIAIYPFDPEFGSFCDEHAKGLEKTKDDPWLLGHFSDNELPLHEEHIVKHYLTFPPGDPCHDAAAKFLAGRNHATPTREDDRAFLQLVVSEYYRKVAVAIRKHDPNHMFLGSRFHGRALASPSPFLGAGPYTDIISVNYYHRWTPENERIENWAKLAGKPILLTEWYAIGVDSGSWKTGAGFLVKTQHDRALFYQHFTLNLLHNPACIGWHWFRYQDGKETHQGIVDKEEKPYELLLKAMKEINTQVYPLKEQFSAGMQKK